MSDTALVPAAGDDAGTAPADPADRSRVSSPAQRLRRPAPRIVRRVGVAAVMFGMIAAVFGTVFALITPAFWGHDEITQFGRAYQVAHGGMLPEKIADTRGVAYGGQVPVSIDDLMDYAHFDYTHNPPEPGPMVGDPGGYDRLESRPLTHQDRTVWFTNTAAYSPVPYVPSAIGIRIAQTAGADTGGVVLAARFAGLLTYLVIVGFALHALRGRRIAWLFFTLALLPIAVFQAGTVTADTVTNALAILFSALFVKAVFLRAPLSRPESLLLLAAAIALPVCKPTYFLLAMLVAIVPRRRLTGLPALRWMPQLSALAGLALFGVWTKVSAGTTSGMGLMRPPSQWHSVVPADQMKWVLEDPIRFLHTFYRTLALRDGLYFTQFFGELGFSYIEVGAVTIVSSTLALVLAFGISERVRPGRLPSAITAAVVVLSVGMIFGTLYLSFSPVGFYIIDGVQGRYFIPLAFVGFATLLHWIPLRTNGIGGRILVRGPVVAIAVLTVLSLTAAALRYHTMVW